MPISIWHRFRNSCAPSSQSRKCESQFNSGRRFHLLPVEVLSGPAPASGGSGAGHRDQTQKLHYVIKKVHAQECELVSDGGTHRLSLRIDKITHSISDDLRQFLGEGFVSLTVVPEGMAFMQLELIFRL